jgi:hypothetical protein
MPKLTVRLHSILGQSLDFGLTSSFRHRLGTVFWIALTAVLPQAVVGQVAVTIAPSRTNLQPGKTLTFTAAVTGTSNTAVSWSIQEGTAGGSITGMGTYTAANTPGAYHVVATSQADSSKSAVAAVVVPGFIKKGLQVQRWVDTATLLSDGRVLFAGGQSVQGTGAVASAEVYDPASDTFVFTKSMATPRNNHSAALLSSGQVLIAGGAAPNLTTPTAELYDPVSGTFSSTGSMTAARQGFTATTLPSGKVLIAGGGGNCDSGCTYFSSAELYDSVSGTFTPTGNMTVAREYHTATLLPNGQVLIAGGVTPAGSSSQGLASTELYNPATGTFSSGPTMSASRQSFTATLFSSGKVLLVGGVVLASADIYDSGTNTITPTGSLNSPRYSHSASLLGNGKILIAGGAGSAGTVSVAELYDPNSGTFTTTGTLNEPRFGHTATALTSGQVLIAGGVAISAISSVEFYDPSSGLFKTKSVFMNSPRVLHSQTVLADGRVLVAGGIDCAGIGCRIHASVEIYDPLMSKFVVTGSMSVGRYSHTATLLNTGKVLIVGGLGGSGGPPLNSAELFDPATGAFSSTGILITARSDHTATLLPSGQVLIAGGQGVSGDLSSAELYDAVSGVFSAAGNMTSTRYRHTATLLNTGKVLIAGGEKTSAGISLVTYLITAEIFDPGSSTFNLTGQMLVAPQLHTATLLQDGRVFIGNGIFASQIFDPMDGKFSIAGQRLGSNFGSNARTNLAAALLPNGQVLMAGGPQNFPVPSELFDPIANTIVQGDEMTALRMNPTATSLPDGNILICGGELIADEAALVSTDIYQSPLSEPIPALTSVTPTTLTGFNPVTIMIHGSTFLSNAVVSLDGNPLATTLVSDTQLSAVVPPSAMVDIGQHEINVSNFGGPSSGPYMILIQNALFDLSPQGSALSFGNINEGSQSPVQTATISVGGNIPLVLGQIVIAGTNPNDFILENSSTCPLNGGSLPTGTRCTIDAAFSPIASGGRNAQISVPNNSVQTPATVALVGTGIAQPVASLSVNSLTFSDQRVGTSSPPQVITLTNKGDLPLVIGGISLVGTTDFSSNNGCSASLAPAASCNINVVFTPSSIGARSTTLTVADNSANSPHALTISGTGVASPPPVPVVSLNPSGTLDFSGTTTQGTSSAPQNIILTNTGNGPLHVTSLAVNGFNANDFIVGSSNCLGTVVAPGANCTIPVTFAPLAAGIRTTTLDITDDATGSPQAVTLNGTATPAVTPSGPTTQSVAAGQPAAYPLTLVAGPGFSGTVSLTCSGAPVGATCVVPASVKVTGANVPFNVAVTTSGPHAAVLPYSGWPRFGPLPPFYPFVAVCALTLLLVALFARANPEIRATRFAWSGTLAMILIVAACGAAGCGGGANGAPPPPPVVTPPGTYTLTVTPSAMSSSGKPLQLNAIQLTLTVTP